MSKFNNGGPAFPGPDQAEQSVYINEGMSIRDYFAAKAMQAILPTITEFPDQHWRKGIAIDAYAMADEMLWAREP